MKEDIEKILEISISAPSGENCQPWKFAVSGNRVDIFNVPEKDLSLYNFKQHGSLIAHGALIENIVISSSQFGYSAQVTLPASSEDNHVSTVIFSKKLPSEERLFESIRTRTSNRFPYKKTPLSDSEMGMLKGLLSNPDSGRIFMVSDRDVINKISRALSVSDRILFENQKIHDFLFEHIIWSEEEARTKRSGFYIKELALPPPVEKVFKFLRRWDRVNMFNKFGFSKIAAKSNIGLYASSAAMIAIATEDDSATSFINAGRSTQRLWLELTSIGLVAQPVTGVIFFMQRIVAGEDKDFSSQHKKMIENAYSEIADAFGAKGKNLAMLLRIGRPSRVAAKSLRLSPNITYT